jgi:hypothetical protein
MKSPPVVIEHYMKRLMSNGDSKRTGMSGFSAYNRTVGLLTSISKVGFSS